MSRAHRARRRREAREKQPVIIAGEGIVAAELGHRFEARPAAKLAPKRPGRHRWMAFASYVLADDLAAGAYDADTMKSLDHENLWELAIGCIDCEQPLPAVGVDSVCPAPEWKEREATS